eukprot:scaffold155152_cov34-Prasinocladus_malaysianus.AAC.1
MVSSGLTGCSLLVHDVYDNQPAAWTSLRAAWWCSGDATHRFGQAIPPRTQELPEARSRYGMQWTDKLSWLESDTWMVRQHLRLEAAYAKANQTHRDPMCPTSAVTIMTLTALIR